MTKYSLCWLLMLMTNFVLGFYVHFVVKNLYKCKSVKMCKNLILDQFEFEPQCICIFIVARLEVKAQTFCKNVKLLISVVLYVIHT